MDNEGCMQPGGQVSHVVAQVSSLRHTAMVPAALWGILPDPDTLLIHILYFSCLF